MTIRRFIGPLAGVLLVSATLAASSACAETHGRMYVRVGPPAPIVETRIVAPGPGFVWVPGYYTWDGRVYVWVPGRWERAPHPRARWVAPRWVHDRRRGWYLVDGHWT
jgi:hypothetical protein